MSRFPIPICGGILLIAGAWPTLPEANGETPALSIEPAIAVRFITEPGCYYQLQARTSAGEEWRDVGLPVVGDGKPFVHQEITPPARAPQFRVQQLHDQWVLVWADEFDGEALDTTRWAREENGYGGGNDERQFYSVDPKYSTVRDGHLELAVHRDPHTTVDGKTQPYSSARIRSLHRGDWLYGRFEIRARVPGGEGIWPAAWMLPSRPRYGTWAASGEIDILESRGSRVEETVGTIHFGGPWPRNTHAGTTWKLPVPGPNAAEAFHRYAIEWERDEIRWYFDDHCYQVLTSDQWHSEAAPDSDSAPFDQPFHLILNVAVDGGFFSGTDQRADHLPDDAFPQVFLIDYVRVYQWAGTAEPTE